MMEKIVTKKQLYLALTYSIYSYGAGSAASDALMRQVRCIGSEQLVGMLVNGAVLYCIQYMERYTQIHTVLQGKCNMYDVCNV